MNAGCAGCEIPWERVPYLRALARLPYLTLYENVGDMDGQRQRFAAVMRCAVCRTKTAATTTRMTRQCDSIKTWLQWFKQVSKDSNSDIRPCFITFITPTTLRPSIDLTVVYYNAITISLCQSTINDWKRADYSINQSVFISGRSPQNNKQQSQRKLKQSKPDMHRHTGEYK